MMNLCEMRENYIIKRNHFGLDIDFYIDLC